MCPFNFEHLPLWWSLHSLDFYHISDSNSKVVLQAEWSEVKPEMDVCKVENKFDLITEVE